MALSGVAFDTAAAPGSKFPSAAVRAELQLLNPGNIAPGEVTEAKLDDLAVSRRTVQLGAIGSPQIGTGEVKTANYADQSITGPKLQDGTVTGDKTGTGVVTVVNSAGDAISFQLQLLTNAEYTAISSPDSGTAYLITP